MTRRTATRASPSEEAREDGRSRVSSGASSRMDDGEDEEDEDDDDPTGGIAPKAGAGAGSTKPVKDAQGKKDAADFERDRQPVFAINQVYAEKASLIRTFADNAAKIFVGVSNDAASWNAERTHLALPVPSVKETHALFTTITATFNPDGSLTEAAKTAKQGTLPVGV